MDINNTQDTIMHHENINYTVQEKKNENNFTNLGNGQKVKDKNNSKNTLKKQNVQGTSQNNKIVKNQSK